MFTDVGRPTALVDGLGTRRLEIHNTSIKAHACCRYKQPAIDAALAIRHEHALSVDDITSVTVGIPSMAVDIIAEPILDKRKPGNVVDAQFSLPFGIAVALQHGRASVVEYNEGALGNETTRMLMDIVTYEVDPDLDSSYPDQWRGWATIRTGDGASYSKTIEHPRGDPDNPMTEADLWTKFTSITEGVYSRRRQHAVRQACSNLESTSFSSFSKLLPAG
jgi:2-methylcitrate dehydratase PrpD